MIVNHERSYIQRFGICADGSWKFYFDMYNSDTPMAPMPQDGDKKDSMKKKQSALDEPIIPARKPLNGDLLFA